MKDLAQRLRALAGTLEKHSDSLDSAAYVKKTAAFSKTLTAFEKATSEAAAGLAPGLHDLGKMFSGPDKKLLKEPEMKKLFSEVLGTRPAADAKAAALHKSFQAAVRDAGLGELALAAAQALLVKARASKAPVPSDPAELSTELLRLGELDDAAFTEEIETRYRKDADLNKLAKAKELKFSKGTPRATKVRELRRAVVRVAGHQIV